MGENSFEILDEDDSKARDKIDNIKGNFYLKRSWRNKNYIGKFSSREEARIAALILKNNDMDIDYFKNHSLFKYGDKYYIFKLMSGIIVSYGVFSDSDEAILKNEAIKALKDNGVKKIIIPKKKSTKFARDKKSEPDQIIKSKKTYSSKSKIKGESTSKKEVKVEKTYSSKSKIKGKSTSKKEMKVEKSDSSKSKIVKGESTSKKEVKVEKSDSSKSKIVKGESTSKKEVKVEKTAHTKIEDKAIGPEVRIEDDVEYIGFYYSMKGLGIQK